MNNNRTGDERTFLTCEACGEEAVRRLEVEDVFDYREGGAVTKLRAVIPVFSCSACGLEYADAEAEDIRHDAVCRHLGVLTPSEIRALREDQLGLSREDLSAVTGIGTASLARWETAVLIQGRAYDRYLRLLRDPAVFARARALASGEPLPQTPAARPRTFRYVRVDDYTASAARFHLQKAS